MVKKRDRQSELPGSSAPPERQNGHVLSLLQKGHQLHQSGNLKAAQATYQEILQLSPDNPDALYLLGSLALQTGNVEPAIKLLSRAITAFPENPLYYLALGNALFNNQRPEDAIVNFKKAIMLAPDRHDAHNNLGNVFTSLGRFDEAISSYRKAVDVDPSFSMAHCNLGHALHGAGYLKESLACYRKAIEITPGFAQAHNNMGVALKDLGHLEQAADSFRAAVTNKPDYADAFNNLGAVYLSMGRAAEAITNFQLATSIAPNFINAHFNTGEALVADNRIEEAASCFKAALRLDPMHKDALEKLGNVYRKQDRLDEAVECYRNSNTPHAQSNALECLFALRQEDAFYEYLEQLIPEDDTNLRVASVSVFAAHQFKRPNPYPFCPNPMDYIRIRNLIGVGRAEEAFLHNILDELTELEARWEPKGKTTRKGYQSDNIFLEPSGNLEKLVDLIVSELEIYHSELVDEKCGFIQQWPKDMRLGGWFVRLLKGGHQSTHTHPLGWISGVVYLKIPEELPGDEGAIEFSIHGNDYPVVDDTFPIKRYHPKEGDLVLFPSSLHHRTMPFNADEERVCIAFDMMPLRGSA